MTGEPSVEYFDKWYAEMEYAPAKDEIEQRHLGLPPHLMSTSLLPWEGIDEVTAALRLESGDVLLDLACGRGGYGMEIAQRTNSRLIGLDFSAVAIRLACEHAAELGREAEFRVGDLTSTGLGAHSVHAAMCIDAIQFAEPLDEALRELRRILRPGGRAVLTCWEAARRDDEAIPQRIRDVDLLSGLTAAGFTEVAVAGRPDWLDRERAMWTEAAELDPGGDPALQSLHDEGVEVLGMGDVLVRVIASATA